MTVKCSDNGPITSSQVEESHAIPWISSSAGPEPTLRKARR